MIRRSTTIAAVAILLSLVVHLLGLSLSWTNPEEQAGSDGANDAVEMGNGFEDVAEALEEPVEPEPAPTPEPPVESPPEPEQADTPTSEALVASDNPKQSFSPDTETGEAAPPETAPTPTPETVSPSGSDAAPVVAETPTEPSGPETGDQAPEESPEPAEAAAAEPELAPEADTPEQLAALPAPVLPVVPVAPAPVPSTIPVIPLEAEPVEAEPTEAVDETEPESPVAEETEGSEQAVVASLRPRLRTQERQKEPRGLPGRTREFSELEIPPAQLRESPLTTYKRDRNDQNFGTPTRSRSGSLGIVGSGGSGNSDVTNYAGRVLVHLNRTPPVPVSGRGFARIFFQINADGSLAWVDVIDGTGSAEINRAAKEQIRSGAPFPLPPGGKSRKLVFVYQIR